jgi:hypothetical protein
MRLPLISKALRSSRLPPIAGGAPDDDPLDEPAGANGAGADAAGHVRQILEAAEQAADAVRAEAEAEAKRYLEEYRRRVDDLDSERARVSETLIEQATKMREQYSRFLETIDGALSKASESGADRGLIDRLRGERDAAREIRDEEAAPEEPQREESEERRRWPIDPRPRRRDPRPSNQDPRSEQRRDPRPSRDQGGDEGILPGGYRPRSRSGDE